MRWMVLLFWPGIAAAQGAECYDETYLANLPQQPLNICAAYRYEQSDAELNRLWRLLEANYRNMETLRAAQRAWITFRDLTCFAEAEGVRGGSIYPLVLNGCLERQTLRRIEDLQQFADIR